jgi:hypothetical protein
VSRIFFTSGTHDPHWVPARLHALSADGVADVARAHVVAGADLHVVGQVGGRGRLGAGGREVGAGLGSELAAEERAERAVRRRVADEDAAEEGPRVVAHHDLLVQPAGGIRVDDLERALRAAEGVAEGRDLDAGQLELRRVVDAGEHGLAARDPVGDRLRHRVRGRDEADAHAVDRGDLADGPHVRGGRAAGRVDRDAAARTDREARVARQLVARGDPDGEHDDVGGDRAPVGEGDAGDAAGRRREDPRRPHPQVQLDALAVDDAAERLAGALVELGRHEPAPRVHDRRPRAERVHAARGLEPEEAAAHRHDVRGPTVPLTERGDLGDQPGDVGEGAVHAAGRGAVDGRDGGGGSGRQHELVVREDRAVVEGDRARVRVDARRAASGAAVEGHVVPEAGGAEREVDLAGEALRELDAVVGEVRLVADHGDPEGGRRRIHAGRERLGEPVGRGSAAHDDDAADAVGPGRGIRRPGSGDDVRVGRRGTCCAHDGPPPRVSSHGRDAPFRLRCPRVTPCDGRLTPIPDGREVFVTPPSRRRSETETPPP